MPIHRWVMRTQTCATRVNHGPAADRRCSQHDCRLVACLQDPHSVVVKGAPGSPDDAGVRITAVGAPANTRDHGAAPQPAPPHRPAETGRRAGQPGPRCTWAPATTTGPARRTGRTEPAPQDLLLSGSGRSVVGELPWVKRGSRTSFRCRGLPSSRREMVAGSLTS
jgi:hypothetical protein